MTDEATPGETESSEPETPPTPERRDGCGTLTRRKRRSPRYGRRSPFRPPAAAGRFPTARAEARKTRLVLPFLLPLGAILVVAFYTFNISRVFLASSEGDTTPAVVIAAGITLSHPHRRLPDRRVPRDPHVVTRRGSLAS